MELDGSLPIEFEDRSAADGDLGTSSSNLSAVINKDLSLLDAMHKLLRLKPGSLCVPLWVGWRVCQGVRVCDVGSAPNRSSDRQ